ncbi:MAG: 4Fe-4S binding protein [Desulfovibrionaceae bacterium]|nr:4Fe-4S binding protein [Desulfovibrionaceae bacterium]
MYLNRKIRTAVRISILAIFLMRPIFPFDMTVSLYAADFSGVMLADPLIAVQMLLAGVVPALPLWLGTAVGAAIQIAVGRKFCRWICPFGLLSEWGFHIRRKLIACGLSPVGSQMSRFRMLLFLLSLSALTAEPVLSMLSMPGRISLLGVIAAQEGMAFLASGFFLLPLAALGIEFVLGQRIWCRCFCPQVAAAEFLYGETRKVGRAMRVLTPCLKRR